MHCSLNLKNATLLISLSLFLFFSCNKSGNGTPPLSDENGNGYPSDISRMELYTDDAISICDAAGATFNGQYMRTTNDTPNTFGVCATVSTDTVDIPHTLIIRFGETPCKCLDGRTRSGSIQVSYSGEYTDPLQTHTITFTNYYINGMQFTGTILTTRIDTTVVGNWYYDVNTLDTLVNSPNQYTIWQSTLKRQWVAGYNTLSRADDVFQISGWAQLTRTNLHQYAVAITTSLQIALDCNYMESGVATVTGYDGSGTINYGQGTCTNNQAILYITDTTNGSVAQYPLTLVYP